eukprot:gene12409-12544_t
MQAAASGLPADADADAEQYLEVQRRAAAVQLHSRTLAIAHLRALLSCPRGGGLAFERADRKSLQVKTEPRASGTAQQPSAAVKMENMPAITVTVSSTANDLQLPPPPATSQQQQQHHGTSKSSSLKPRLLVHRLPDTAAIQRFTADELPEAASPVAEDHGMPQQVVSVRPAVVLAPRIVADPAVVSHQLAGWVKVAGDGVEEGAVEGSDEEELLGPGASVQDDKEDMMDEEEWI